MCRDVEGVSGGNENVGGGVSGVAATHPAWPEEMAGVSRDNHHGWRRIRQAAMVT